MAWAGQRKLRFTGNKPPRQGRVVRENCCHCHEPDRDADRLNYFLSGHWLHPRCWAAWQTTLTDETDPFKP